MEATEAQRLRAAIEAHRHAMREYRGAEYDLELWKVLDDAGSEQAAPEAPDRIAKLDKDMNFLRMVMSTMQERVHGELRHLDSAIDMDRKRLDAIENKLKALSDAAYDEAGGQAGWATQPLPGGE